MVLALLIAAAGPWLGCRERSAEHEPVPPLRIGLRGGPLSFDPHLRNEVLTISVLGNAYEALTGFDTSAAVRPVLAERWENPDDVTWRFVLREGARFHDGTPLTAEDVVFSIDRARFHPDTNFSSFLVEVEEVRAVDSSTVEVVTKRPYPILLNKLAFIFVAPAGSPEEISRPVGTGPYRIVSDFGDAPILLERFDDYWGAVPAEPRAEIHAVPAAPDRVALLRGGDLDVVHDLEPSQLDEISADPCCRVISRRGLAVEYLALDPRWPPFDDIRVRTAVDLAVDRDEIVEREHLGHAVPLGQLVAVDVFGYDPSLEPTERDLATARRLLAEAGHPDGIDVVLEHREGRKSSTVVEQLGEAGIRVTTDVRPWAEIYERQLAGLIHFYFGGIVAVAADASDILDSLVHSKGNGYGQHNDYDYRNPEVDRLVEESGLVFEGLERRQLLSEVLRLVRDDRVFLPLFSPNEIYGVGSDVEWAPRLDGFIRAAEIRRGDG